MLAAFAGTLLLSGSKAEDERLVIDDQGRVGVNEPAPQRRLHIKDVGGGMVRLTKTGVVAREWDINVTTNGSFAIGDNSAQADRVHIDVNGRVGVNETAPGKRLQITDAGGEMIRMKKTVGVPREWDINVTTNGSFALGDNTSGGDRLVIDTNGNIAIGGGSPSFKLQVAGTVAVTSGGFRFPDGSLQTTAAAGSASAAGLTGQIQFNGGAGFAGDAQLYWDNANKRLGLGTTAPLASFHTKGDALFEGIVHSFNSILIGGTSDRAGGKNGQGTVYMDGFDDRTGLSSNFPVASQVYYIRNAADNDGVSMGLRLVGYGTQAAGGMIWTKVGGSGQASSAAWDLRIFTTSAGDSGCREQMRIKNDGNVGIGTTAPSYKLDVSGSPGRVAHRSDNYSSWDVDSDARVKQDVVTLSGSLERLARLRPVTFAFTEEFKRLKPELDGRKVGFIGQEVREVLPELTTLVAMSYGGNVIEEERVISSGNGSVQTQIVKSIQEGSQTTLEDFHTLNTSDLIPMFVDAMKELKTRNETLEARCAALEARLTALENR